MKYLHTSAYIDGKWRTKAKTFPVHNPYNQEVIANVADCEQLDMKDAIEAAHTAFLSWSKLDADSRSRILKRWYQLQIDNIEDLAKLLTLEQGKPLTEARGEIKYGASFVEWFAEEARRVYGDVIPGHTAHNRIIVLKQPIGVVGAITPWNFPNAMITRKVAPALAVGCTVVVKPSDLTPLSALALAALAEEAGFPAGVFNIVTCKNPQAIGEELTSNPLVKKISFTGSTKVGKLLLAKSADQVKKVTLELGGNAPFIVFDDADIDLAVDGCIASKFRNTGQTCVCTNRIFAQATIYEQFVEKLGNKIQALKTGNGLDAGVEIGPLINQSAVLKNEQLLADALEKGAQIKVGGLKMEGLFFEPTLVCEVQPNMKIFREEIFGPVAAVCKFQTEVEVIQLANDTPFGLASYFYGRDYARIWRVAEALECGMVGINTGMISTAIAPFGGIKESGFGREGSKYGIDDFVNLKYLCWGEVK
jgi:succinate-semialdehyde dehydrogenase/glutarate-semialdehyde dehydrogenase